MTAIEQAPSFAGLAYDVPLYRTAIAQLDAALAHTRVDPGVAERLRHPERSLAVSVPVTLDDGSKAVLPGYRVQHSSVLGPTTGGVRYDASLTLGQCAALAMWTTWTCALLRLPYGGAAGGVRCDPGALSDGERERITRRYMSELLPVIGPKEDIPSPELGTDGRTMAWMMDTYSMQRGFASPEIVTGKPIAIGGSVFREEATGAGVAMVVARACERLGWKLSEQRCAVQGLGNVGAIAARELVDRGATIVGVADVSGGVHDPEGLDVADVLDHVVEHGTVAGFPGGEPISSGDPIALDCDILVLAAREEQVGDEDAARVRARLVVEGANGPLSTGADASLHERGVTVLPDVLVNAGGVAVSYFEWVQDLGRLFWGRDEIRAKLAEQLNGAFDRVWSTSRERSLPLRTAALLAGIDDVATALGARGLYP